MQGRPRPRSRARHAGFSLPEVTMAAGIVAAVALPLLAMLAGGGTTQSSARDRQVAARLAREVRASLVVDVVPDRWRLLLPGDCGFPVSPPGGEGAAIVVAADHEGRWLGPVEESRWRSGLGEAGVFFLVRLELAPTSPDSQPFSGPPLLCDLTVTVAHPAMAELGHRRTEIFSSRFPLP